LSTIRARGFEAFASELGVTGMAIFIRQFENGSGDYTEEREEILKDVSIDDIAASIKKRKGQWGLSFCTKRAIELELSRRWFSPPLMPSL